jgi:hypothetical protein
VTRIAVLAACCAILAGPAQAQSASREDTAAINNCLNAADYHGNFGGNCVGIVADPCIKTAGTTNEYVEKSRVCAARELAVWNALLTSALAQVKKGGFAEITKAAESAQAPLRDSINKLCPVFENLDPGMSRGGANYCRLQETARRALTLRRLAAAVNEH